MDEEMLVSVAAQETRVAMLAEGVLQDLYIERKSQRGLLGNIYRGKVVRVLPGTQSAFVDIGEHRTGFLHVADIPVSGAGVDDIPHTIQNCLREGQSLTVQVIKEPVAEKGARLSARLALSSRYLVYQPQRTSHSISAKIREDDERSRLRSVLDALLETMEPRWQGGFILRTAATGVERHELAADLRLLQHQWSLIAAQLSAAPAPSRVYAEPPLYQRAIRDLAQPGLRRIRVDDTSTLATLRSYCSDYAAELVPLLELYDDRKALFDLYALDAEIDLALQCKVELPSGGNLLIEQTQAMTTIDVNTARSVGRGSEQETILHTNLEAAIALARQLRLRNLGGIVIVDFIDMRLAAHRQQVLDCLADALQRDSARCVISGVSALGLVEITRQRSRESLAQVLCEPCPVCAGRGELKSVQTMCQEIFRRLLQAVIVSHSSILKVRAAPAVVEALLDKESAAVADIERCSGKTIQFQTEPAFSREQFDLILL